MHTTLKPSESTIPRWMRFIQRTPAVAETADAANGAHLAVPEDEGDDASSEEDEAETVNELLFGAQMDLIAHKTKEAIHKLTRAAGLGSSAACATLSTMFARGLRSQNGGGAASTSPVSPPLLSIGGSNGGRRSRAMSTSSLPQPTESDVEVDALVAASWAIKGLVIEISKPALRVRKRREKKEGNDEAQMGYDDDSDDGHEGVTFSLERALDLVVALTDAYRFGVLRMSDDNEAVPDESSMLWEQGAEIARKTLRHSAVLLPARLRLDPTPLPPSLLVETSSNANDDRPSMSGSGSKPVLVPTRSGSSTRVPTARSYHHPSTSIPVTSNLLSPTSRSSHFISPLIKLRLTIHVHCCYLLALQKWPINKTEAAAYWQEIVRVSGGGAVGTKEGDEIVLKTVRRLDQIDGKSTAEDEWKDAKRRKGEEEHKRQKTREIDLAAASALVMDGEVGSLPLYEYGSVLRERGDALADIWRLKNGLAKGLKDPWAPETEEPASEPSASGAVPPLTFTRLVGQGPSSNLAGSRPTSLTSPDPPAPLLEPLSGAAAADELAVGSKVFKFHFGGEYPSPPASPKLLARSTSSSSSSSPTSKAPNCSKPVLRHRTSTSSFQPPTLLARVRSSASVSTLPPDFFSARDRNGSATWNGFGSATVGHFAYSPAASTSRLNPLNASVTSGRSATSASSWKDSFRSRAMTMQAKSMRVAEVIRSRNPFSSSEGKGKSAETFLRKVLQRDNDRGMYWTNEGEESEQEDGLEGLQEEETEVVVVPTSRTGGSSNSRKSAGLRAQRSFIDPTQSTPRLTHTPPSPSKSAHPLRAPFSADENAPHLAPVPIDPLLLALEKASRMGVRTRCATCAVKGLNFAKCPRCEKTYCSRSCRISILGGVDGSSHSCTVRVAEQVDVKGKGREVVVA